MPAKPRLFFMGAEMLDNQREDVDRRIAPRIQTAQSERLDAQRAQMGARARAAGRQQIKVGGKVPSLPDDALELRGLEGGGAFRADIAQSSQPGETSKNVLFVAAEDEQAVASARRPELGLDAKACLFGRLAEVERAGGALPNGTSALFSETDEGDV